MDKQEYQTKLEEILNEFTGDFSTPLRPIETPEQAKSHKHLLQEIKKLKQESLQAICLLNEEAMPKKKKIGFCETEWDYQGESHLVKGHNQLRKELKQIIGVSNV